MIILVLSFDIVKHRWKSSYSRASSLKINENRCTIMLFIRNRWTSWYSCAFPFEINEHRCNDVLLHSKPMNIVVLSCFYMRNQCKSLYYHAFSPRARRIPRTVFSSELRARRVQRTASSSELKPQEFKGRHLQVDSKCVSEPQKTPIAKLCTQTPDLPP